MPDLAASACDCGRSGGLQALSVISHTNRSPPSVRNGHGMSYLQDTARERRNVFEALMEAVKTHSLGQISHALYDVGGEYRRNM